MTASLGQQLAQLSPAQRALLLRRLRQREPQRAGDQPAPLSYAQERLWFLDQLDRGNPAYNIPFALRIAGPLDRDALELALNDVVRRHAALRTVFPLAQGQPGQVVRADLELLLPVTDLGDLPSPDREAEVTRLAAAHARQRFALASGPLLSARLLALGTEHLLLVAVHHIVFDGWSTAVFVNELAAHYTAAVTGQPACLPALPVQFTEWASEERERLSGAAMADHLAHWKRRLTRAPLLSTFPADRPRPAVQRNQGAHRQFRLDPELTGRLDSLARQAGVTLNAAVLAAFAALLRQATGQDDLLLGTPVGGRGRAELEPLIGCFANTLVLRLDLSGDPTLRELTQRAHRAISDAYAHQDAPYARVVEELAPPRDPGLNPLFQIMFSVAAIPEEPRRAGPVTFTPEHVDSGLTDFDLFFTLTRRDGALDGLASYNIDLFLPGTVDDIVGRLQAVLAEFAAHPDRTLSQAESVRRHRVSVTASFTADPVREPADFWLRFLRMPVELQIAPYGQVVPHLLAGGDDDAATVCLLRWEDWLRHREAGSAAEVAAVLDRAVQDLGTGLRAFRERTAAPLVVGICPPSEDYQKQPWAGLFVQLDDRLSGLCRQLPGVSVILPGTWTERYPMGQVHDARADTLGHVPYSARFFTVLGTHAVRQLARRWTRPVHTIVLDPVGLLDRPDGQVAAALRRLAAQQARYGRQVVVSGPVELGGAPLRTLPTAADPAALVAELTATGEADPAGCLVLSADPDTCARVLARFPDAVALAVPTSGQRLSRFLDHVWILDAPVEPGAASDAPAGGRATARATALDSALESALDSARLAYLATQLTDPAVIADRSRPAGTSRPAADGPLVSPRTHIEERLAALWREVLPGSEIGVHSDFFALGGHSLLATHLLSRVHAEFGYGVPLHIFFTHPTIERLAAVLDEHGHGDDPIPVVPRDGELAPSSTQQRLWTAAQIGDDPGRHNVTFAAVLHGRLDAGALRDAVARIVDRHEILRTTFPDREGVPVLAIHDRLECWLPDVDLTGVPDAERAAMAREYLRQHATHHYDLAHGPLLRVRLLTLGLDEHHLLVGTHHIVSDNWSWDIFLRELAALYGELTGSAPAGLPSLPVQFADYAAWQRSWLYSPAAEPHVAYWRSRLADAPPTLALPADRPRPAFRSDRADRSARTFAPGLGRGLRDLASGEGATLFSALLAGFAGLLHRYSGQDDMVLGSPIAARHRPELESLIGYFADILPLRLDLTGEPTFRELTRRVHETVVDAYAHQELPFASIVEAVQPPRDPAYHPVVQCLFNFVDLPDSTPTLAGFRMEPLDVPSNGTDFDLFLTLFWQDGELCTTLDYRTDLYDPDTATRLLASLEALLAAGLTAPDRPVGELDPGPSFAVPAYRPATPPAGRPGMDGPAHEPGFAVAIASSFTAEPLQDALRFWLEALEVPATVGFAPYAQVFQQLLDDDGILGAAADGVNIVLLRWEDWLRFQGELPRAGAVSLVERALCDLAAAVRVFRARSAAPLVLGVCPASERYRQTPWGGVLAGLTDRLVRLAARYPDTHVLRLDRVAERYDVTEVCDAHADELGHIPYTPEYFAALGTVIAREVCRWRGPRLRALAVDLAAPAGGSHQLLRLLYRQLRYGRHVLLCPADDGSGVPVTLPDHVRGGGRVIHGPGGDMVDQLAELAGSGVFDPASCAVLTADAQTADRVRRHFPTASVLSLPDQPAALHGLAEHSWMFDPPAGAHEDPATVPSLDRMARVSSELTDARAIVRSATGRKTTGCAYVAPRTEHERTMARIWSELLHVDPVGVEDSFFGLGGDSMVAIQVVSQANRSGIAITPRQLMANPTIASLVRSSPQPDGAVEQGPEQGTVEGAAPLTPPQRWFLDEIAPTLPHPAHFNHPYYLTLRAPVDPAHLQQALDLLARHHDALRLRFTRDGTEWQQEHPPAGPVPFASHDLSTLASADRAARMVALAAQEQAGLDLTAGPLVRAVHFRLGPDEPDRLLIVNHHLVVDAMSRGVLLADLEALCRQLADGQPPRLPAKTTSYRDWADRLHEYAQSERLRGELPFWLEQTGTDAGLPVDHPTGQPTFGSIRTVDAALTEPETAALRQIARAQAVKLSDLVAAVLATALADWTGDRDCALAVAGHGRADLFTGVDLSRTVGWFQVYYPVRLRVPGPDAGSARLTAVVRQLERVPANGIGYGLLRYCHADADVRTRLAALPPPQVTFNYMGDFSFAGTPAGSDLFDVPDDPFGPPQDERGRWPYLLDVVPALVDRRLRIELNYSVDVHRVHTAERLLTDLTDRLRHLIRQVDDDAGPVHNQDPADGKQKERTS